jgi:hypothetical protein
MLDNLLKLYLKDIERSASVNIRDERTIKLLAPRRICWIIYLRF